MTESLVNVYRVYSPELQTVARLFALSNLFCLKDTVERDNLSTVK